MNFVEAKSKQLVFDEFLEIGNKAEGSKSILNFVEAKSKVTKQLVFAENVRTVYIV